MSCQLNVIKVLLVSQLTQEKLKNLFLPWRIIYFFSKFVWFLCNIVIPFNNLHKFSGRYCGTYENLITHLVDHYAVVTYVRLSNLNEPNVGFRIHYAVVCGTGTVIPINEFRSYVLKSPNFSDAYDPFSNCLWEFKAPDNYKIKVKFNFFAIESSPDCKSDFLQIEDATKHEMPVIERYCGKQNPGEVDTDVNNIFIKFSTNNNNDGIGFQAEISAEPIVFWVAKLSRLN